MTALLGGPLAERARIAVDAASALLVSVSADAITDPSYAVGAAGLAIAHANLHALFPARGHDRCTELLLERARTLAATARASPWLVQGIAGVGWATGYLTGDSGSSLDAFDAKLDRLVTGPGPLPAEVFHGTAGLLLYARGRPGALAEHVLDQIARTAQGDADRASWLSTPQVPSHPQEPFVDLGFAHGVPGILAVLATCTGEAFAGDVTRDLVRRSARYIVEARLPDAQTSAYAAYAGRAEPTRSAYCYGDPGVAWALTLAADALDDGGVRAVARGVAQLAAGRGDAQAAIDEAGLCHGAAGLAYLLHKIGERHDDEELRAAAREAFARALAMPGRDGLPFLLTARAGATGRGAILGILGGVAGVALALATALGEIDDAWDEPLLAGRAARDDQP